MSVLARLHQFAAALLSPGDIGYQGPTTSNNLMNNILMPVYFWAGIVAVGFIVYGGFMYVLSSGEAGKVKKAKDTLLYAVIGLVVVLFAFAITKFIAGSTK
jgi:hypothetical protein